MSSLPLGASNSSSLPSQIRVGGMERVGNIGMEGEREREMSKESLREPYPLHSLKVGGEKWGWKDKGWG